MDEFNEVNGLQVLHLHMATGVYWYGQRTNEVTQDLTQPINRTGLIKGPFIK